MSSNKINHSLVKHPVLGGITSTHGLVVIKGEPTPKGPLLEEWLAGGVARDGLIAPGLKDHTYDSAPSSIPSSSIIRHAQEKGNDPKHEGVEG